ncbi:MAG: transporter substrate-binding domain-containing protein [Actinomycetota bacterium]|nr:MAG: ABC transporter substrate-binding [Actinomycetota bacterium]MDO8948901.1 transporter substrate-binding domain-containing protein [Actinomycetota bacterium]MDP3629809.1 transporter substrate-binding domain-containing protein [Actinomycetota bacterium]
MSKTGKIFALLMVFALLVSALALGGCAKKDEGTGTTPPPAEKVGIKSVDDLKKGDKVAVQSGTTGEGWAKENLEPKGIVVVPYDDVLLAFSALQAGDVLGVINDLPISQDVVKDQTRGLEIVQEITTNEAYGFAFSKKNTVLRDSVNWALAEVIKDGSYNTIYAKWFGSEPMSMPKAVSGITAKPAGELKTLTAGKIILGSDTAYPPFENVEGGATVGFDVDLMAAIAAKLGLTSEFKSYKFDALITGVQAGSEFDMVASAMTITDERKQSIDFSDPYINSNQSLAVKKAQ